LRERPDDIVPLARHFLAGHARRAERQAWFSPEAEALLKRYTWPGNVRELENTAQRALILTPGDTVSAETLRICLPNWQPESSGYKPGAPQGLAAAPGAFAANTSPVAGERAARSFDMANIAAPAPVSDMASNPASSPVNMRDFEREHILATLREMGGSRKKTVEKLGISERTLRYKLKLYREEGYEV
jgi:two-component system response regulator FlrC